MTDGFGLDLRIGGRPKAPLTFHKDRELTEGDLETLAESRGSKAPSIKKLRARHHALAKVLATGVPDGEAGLICGYSASRVSILKGDRSFQELMVFYQDSSAEKFVDQKILLQDISLDALADIQEKLEDDDNPLSLSELLEVSKLTLDRSGFGPSSKTTVDVKVGLADKMHEAAERSARMKAERAALNAKDVTPND